MQLTIHRGSQEIGGTCIEVATSTTKILLDIGSALNPESKPLDMAAIKADAVVISHPHQDHFGLIGQVPRDVPVYIGELAKDMLDATRIFIDRPLFENRFEFYRRGEPFNIGDFRITPYLVDHSAVDAYAFLIEADGKRLFYSGDFRGHGRKQSLFHSMIDEPPHNIDVLLMEGTMFERDNDDFPSEKAVQDKIGEVIRYQRNASFIISSSQNIDRVVSAYNACKEKGNDKILVLDFYTAFVLNMVKSVSAGIRAMKWSNIRVLVKGHSAGSQYAKLSKEYNRHREFLKHAFEHSITIEEVHKDPSRFLFFSKISSGNFIESFLGGGPINVIYSQWLGDLKKTDKERHGAPRMKSYQDGAVNGVVFTYAHTSGHAIVEDLQKFAKALNPKTLIPIHTEYGYKYKEHFSNVVEVHDNFPFEVIESGGVVMDKDDAAFRAKVSLITKKVSFPNKPSKREDLINWRLEYMAKMATELKHRHWDEADAAANHNMFIRINGESYQTVSLSDSYALCHWPTNSEKKAPEEKRERRLQCWIIRQALIKKRNLLDASLFGEALKGHFDELIFAFDEISFGDLKHKPTIRLDVVAVGKKGQEVFPVVIELKSERSWKRLSKQLEDAANEVKNYHENLSSLLEIVTGVSVSKNCPAKKILVWPGSASGIESETTMAERKKSGVLFIEYAPKDFNSPDNVTFILRN